MTYDPVEFCSIAPGSEEFLGCDVELVREEMVTEADVVIEAWGWRSLFEGYRVTHGWFATQTEARADALKRAPALWPA